MKVEKTHRLAALKLLIILMGLLYLSAGLFKMEFLWGVNHLKYFPVPYAVIFAVAVAAGLFDQSLSSIWRFLRYIREILCGSPFTLKTVLIIIAALGLFLLLRVKVHTLGDGYQRVYQIERGYYFYPAEALDFFLHAVLFRIAQIFTDIPAEYIYISFSILCGTIFILVLFRDFALKSNGDGAGLALPCLSVCLGGSLLFFGYVESYSLYYPAALLFILYSFRYIYTGQQIVTASVLYGIALLSHQSALFLLPAFIWLIYHNYVNGTDKPQKMIPILIGSASVLIFLSLEIFNRIKYGEYLRNYSDTFLPLAGSDYSVISAGHLLDLLNLFLLIFPLIPIFLFMIFSGPNRPASPDFQGKWFLRLALLGCLSFLFFVDPKLGMPRDWDLFATPTATLAVIIMVYTFSRNQMTELNRFRFGYFSLLFFSLWVAVNCSDSRQLARAESILNLSGKGREYGTELLAYHYRNKLNDKGKALALFQSIEGKGRNSRVLSSIAQMQLEMGQAPQALATAKEGIAKDSTGVALYAIAGSILLRYDSSAAALPYLQEAYELNPEVALNSYKLGQAYYNLGNDAAAINAFKSALKIEPDSYPVLFSIGQTYLRQGMLDSAYIYIESGLKLNPQDQQAWELMNFIRSQRQ